MFTHSPIYHLHQTHHFNSCSLHDHGIACMMFFSFPPPLPYEPAYSRHVTNIPIHSHASTHRHPTNYCNPTFIQPAFSHNHLLLATCITIGLHTHLAQTFVHHSHPRSPHPLYAACMLTVPPLTYHLCHHFLHTHLTQPFVHHSLPP